MIVKKFWTTRKTQLEPGYTTIYETITKNWKGYFLFGIIPLYIEQI